MEFASAPGGNPNDMLFKMGVDYLEQAKAFEAQGKIEQAYKLFKEAANKFMYIIKNSEGQVEPSKIAQARDLAQKAIDSGLWVKT